MVDTDEEIYEHDEPPTQAFTVIWYDGNHHYFSFMRASDIEDIGRHPHFIDGDNEVCFIFRGYKKVWALLAGFGEPELLKQRSL